MLRQNKPVKLPRPKTQPKVEKLVEAKVDETEKQETKKED